MDQFNDNIFSAYGHVLVEISKKIRLKAQLRANEGLDELGDKRFKHLVSILSRVIELIQCVKGSRRTFFTVGKYDLKERKTLIVRF